MIQSTSISTPSPAQNRGVKVTAFLDASEEIVEPFGAKRVDCLEKAKADAPDLEATATVFRSGKTPKQKLIKGLGLIGANLAVPVVGAVLGGPVGLAIGVAVGAGLFIAGLGRQGLGELESARWHRSQLPDMDWKGMRKYEIAADKTPGFDSAATVVEDFHTKPTSADLTDLLVSSMDASKTNIVYLLGHGLGYRQSASMPLTELRDSLAHATQKTGARADVLVMESCLMGNMEAMNELEGVASVAVVSEETIAVDALPVREMMADAAKNGGTAQEIGKRMVEIASKSENISTLTAVDLQKMPALMKSLDKLGSDLAGEIANGRGKAIKTAVEAAMAYPQGKLSFLDRKMIRFSDLGNFIDALPAAGVGAGTQASAQAARQAMKDAILAEMHSDDYDRASGFSFQNSAAGMTKALDGSPEMSHYDQLNLPRGWREFIRALDGVK